MSESPRSIKIRPVEELRKKFKKRIEVSAPEYEAGITSPLRNWLDEFESASDAIADALRKVAEDKTFLLGAKRVGQKKWHENVKRKGPARWRDETPKRDTEWAAGFKPFHEELSKIVLARKRPKGDPANIDERVKPVVQALRKRKEEERRGVSVVG
ncbi:MAG: hypothetical protein QW734_06415 [Candidatus Bathyarchaeia archaeon]